LKRITVLLAEDNKAVREGIRVLLEAEDDLNVVGEAKNGRQAVKMAKRFRPAVVVMDISMPLLNGLEATRQIRKDFPDIKVLILSAHGDAAYVEQAIALGAAGFLLKQTSPNDLPKAIREVQKGNVFFSPSIGKPSSVQSNTPSPERFYATVTTALNA
jgi:DNA-binding NarL/FixJ family response regulator